MGLGVKGWGFTVYGFKFWEFRDQGLGSGFPRLEVLRFRC